MLPKALVSASLAAVALTVVTMSPSVPDARAGGAGAPGLPSGHTVGFVSVPGSVFDEWRKRSRIPRSLETQSNRPGVEWQVGERGRTAGTPRTSSPVTSTSAAPRGLTWNADLETGDLSQFDDTPWNQVGGPAPRVVSNRALVREGRHALEVTLPPGGARNELVPLDGQEFTDGDERYFGFSMRLAPDFPVDASWQVLTQWKNDGTGSPPLALIVEDGRFALHGGHGRPGGPREFRHPIAPAVAGQWDDWVFHIRFDDNPADGFVEVWRNGQLIVPRFSPQGGTLYPRLGSYLKLGYYRSTGIMQEGTVYFDDWWVGTAPARGARTGG